MPAREFNNLWKAIDVLEAQEHLALSRALLFPHLKPRARAERDKKLSTAAYPRDIYKKEAKSSAFLVNTLGGKRAK